MKFGTRRARPRKEDDARLRGAGRYVAAVAPAGALAAVVLRAPHAHAEFRVTDVAKARALPGVRLVLLADDIAELGPMPCTGVPPDVTLEAPIYPVLTRHKVVHVGDAVAFIVADTLDQARDAAEAAAIDHPPPPR